MLYEQGTKILKTFDALKKCAFSILEFTVSLVWCSSYLRQPRDREEGPQTPGVGRLMGTPGLALAGRLSTVRKGKSELQ